MAKRVTTGSLEAEEKIAGAKFDFQHIEIAGIEVDVEKQRHVSDEQIDALAESIGAVGQLQSVIVCKRGNSLHLVAGWRRYLAKQKLRHTTINAIVIADGQSGDEHFENRIALVEIDENLQRVELSPAERALCVIRRKSIYEKLYPETKHGARGGKPRKKDPNLSSFTANTARQAGRSKSDVGRDVTRGKKLGEDILARIIGTCLDTGSELDALSKLSPQDREHLVLRAQTNEPASAQSMLPVRPCDALDYLRQFKVSLSKLSQKDWPEFLDDPIVEEIRGELDRFSKMRADGKKFDSDTPAMAEAS